MGEDVTSEAGQAWAIADSLLDAIVLLDAEGRIEGANAAWLADPAVSPAGNGAKLSGVGRLYLSVCRSSEKNPLSDLPKAAEIKEGLQSVLEGRAERYLCEYSRRRGNDVQWFLAMVTRRPGSKKGAVVVHQNITGFFRRGEVTGQTIFGTLLEGTADGIFMCDPEGYILIANTVLCRWLGKPAEEVVGRKGEEVAGGGMLQVITGENAEILRSGRTRSFEISASTAEGDRIFAVSKGVYRGAGNGGRAVFGFVRDITELRAIQREIIEISDKEKQRLGQELHENLCQYLVGISLLGNVLHEDLVKMKLKQAEDARQITALVKDAISEVRSLVKGLSPIPHEHQGELVTALGELAEHARAVGKIRCSLRVPRSANDIDPVIAMHLYRIAQEAVHNAIKHSGAKRLEIVLSQRRDALVLTVKDDGVGLDSASAKSVSGGTGYGLYLMNYRSRAIGGTLAIRLPSRGGTTVVCTVPIQRSFSETS